MTNKIEPLSDVASIQNETGAITTINGNNEKIENAFANTLSRDGSAPNAMGANLDLGSHRIINLAAAVDPNDAVRKADLDAATGSLDADLVLLIQAAPANAAAAQDAATAAAASAYLASQYIGAAVSADKWTTARSITLAGAMSGTASFDGSANFSLTATIVDGSVTAPKLASGAALSNLGYTPTNKAGDTLTGDLILAAAPASLNAYSVGFRGLPLQTRDTNYTFVLSDSGQLQRHTSASAHAWTVPPNSSVAYPLGTAIPLRNFGAGAVTITQGAGVSLRIAGSSTTGNKTLAQYGFATLIQEATDNWVIIGTGVS